MAPDDFNASPKSCPDVSAVCPENTAIGHDATATLPLDANGQPYLPGADGCPMICADGTILNPDPKYRLR